MKHIGCQTQFLRILPTDSVLTIRLKEIDWKELRESLKKKQKELRESLKKKQ